MHGPCTGNIKQASVICGVVIFIAHIWNNHLVKFQTLRHLEGGHGAAVCEAGAVGSNELHFIFRCKLMIQLFGNIVCFEGVLR